MILLCWHNIITHWFYGVDANLGIYDSDQQKTLAVVVWTSVPFDIDPEQGPTPLFDLLNYENSDTTYRTAISSIGLQ